MTLFAMLAVQCLFVQSAVRAGARASLERATPPWVVPCVGISAASGTGAQLIRWAASGSPALTNAALFGPLAPGAMWA